MSLRSNFKTPILAAVFSALLSTSAMASDEAALKLADDAMAALKQGQIEQTTKLYDEALVQANLSTPVRGQILSAKANALLEIAWATRQDTPLLEAIDTFELAVKVLDAKTSPTVWAQSNSRLGEAYRSLAYGKYNQNKPEEGAKLYNNAIVAYTKAIEVLNQDDNPNEWATAQRALGQVYANSDTYLSISGNVSNATRLTEAEDAFQAAMNVYTKDADPVSWAGLQFQLGDIYTTLHQRQGGTFWLEKSIKSHKSVLEVITKDNNPNVWAQVQYFIGNGLVELGSTFKDKAMLKEAIVASESATQSDYFENIFPEFYERNQNNIKVAKSLITKLDEAK